MYPAPYALGKRGEQLACDFLQRKGLQLVATNWRCKLGEIDLIMQEGSTRAFVEVRLRSPTHFGEGYDTVAYEKQRKLIRAVKFYQQLEHYWGDIRFDVVSITADGDGKPIIEHIENAFTL